MVKRHRQNLNLAGGSSMVSATATGCRSIGTAATAAAAATARTGLTGMEQRQRHRQPGVDGQQVLSPAIQAGHVILQAHVLLPQVVQARQQGSD